MSFPLQKRYYWEINAIRNCTANADYPSVFCFQADFGGVAEIYANLTTDYKAYLESERAKYRGWEYKKFHSVQVRRERFHRWEKGQAGERAVEFLLNLNSNERKELKWSQLKWHGVKRLMLMARHEMTDWQYEPPEKYTGADFTFEVIALKERELEVLDELATTVAKHRAALEVLDEVDHYLNGHDVYDTTLIKVEVSVAADAARSLRKGYPNKSTKELMAIARSMYRPGPDYRGKRDDRSFYRAIHKALTRE